MRGAIPIIVLLLLVSMFGYVQANEIHKNGFGGITPLNITGLTVFSDALKRSFVYESDSLVLSSEFSILETSGVIRDFSLFDNDLTIQNTTAQEPRFVGSTFGTALETINLGVQNQNLTVTADVYADQSFPTNNYGSLTTLLVRSWTGSNNRRPFLQWNVSSILSTATITEAIVWIDKTTDTGSFPRTYEAQAVSASWVEGDLTWSNQPGATGSSVNSVITTADDWYAWDITTIVQNWVDGTWANNGIRIKDATEDSGSEVQSTWNSREAATNDPSLNISYTMGQWAEAPHSESLDMEDTDASLVWWGQIRDSPSWRYITGKGCSVTIPYVYGLVLSAGFRIEAAVAGSACSSDTISTGLPTSGLVLNQTYGIGIVFEDNPWGTDVHFWLDGEWIYNETSTERVGDNSAEFYVGRSSNGNEQYFCNCTHDEVLVFKERLDNSTMQLLTAQEHDIVIKSGPSTTPQGFGGLFFALPWIIVFGLLAWVGYAIFVSLKGIFT